MELPIRVADMPEESTAGPSGAPTGDADDIKDSNSRPYTVLDESRAEIRLLKVHPPITGDHLETIQCSIITDSLADLKNPYITVSYVWGDETDRRTIMVDGHPARIPTSLNDLLSCYRKMCQSGRTTWKYAYFPLWADAVCINQDDVAERNSQVRIMGDIYRAATTTVAWLGLGDEDSDYAIGEILKMDGRITTARAANVSPLSIITPEDTQLWTQDLGRDHQDSGRFTAKNRFWNACARIFERPYWHRSWIAQELVLSNDATLFCGATSVRLSVLVAILMWMTAIDGSKCPSFADSELWALISSYDGRKALGWGELAIMRKIFLAAMPSRDTDSGGWNQLDVTSQPRIPTSNGRYAALTTLRKYMFYTRTSQATDPRDKIFSLLGLVGYAMATDYAKPIEGTYVSFATRCIRADKRLDILCYAGHGLLGPTEHPEHRLFLPTWYVFQGRMHRRAINTGH